MQIGKVSFGHISVCLAMLALTCSCFAQAPAQMDASGSGNGPVVIDTIGERAAAALEAQRLKNNPPPVIQVAPAVAATVAPGAQGAVLSQRAGFAPDHAVTGIRGFSDSLEASFLINGKRASGSIKYPTLVDGWRLVEITPAGATIEKGKERKQLSFAGVVPFQANVSNGSAFAQAPSPFGFSAASGSAVALPSGGSLAPRPSPLPPPYATPAR